MFSWMLRHTSSDQDLYNLGEVIKPSTMIKNQLEDNSDHVMLPSHEILELNKVIIKMKTAVDDPFHGRKSCVIKMHIIFGTFPQYSSKEHADAFPCCCV